MVIQLTHDSATLLLSCLEELNTCNGNPEPKFISLGEAKKKGQLLSADKEVVAYIDSSACVSVGDQQYACTIRCTKCHLLTTEVRCSECALYRKNLLAQHSRATRRNNSAQSKTVNFRYYFGILCMCMQLSDAIVQVHEDTRKAISPSECKAHTQKTRPEDCFYQEAIGISDIRARCCCREGCAS